jgi:iron complex outermembrane receptor protein
MTFSARPIARFLLCGALALAFSPAGFAQEQPPSAAAPTDDSGIEEIVVTANKRAENMQDVPVAVSALPANQLAEQGVFETTDLGGVMPNLQITSPYGRQQPNFSVRGVGVGTEYNANAASPVGVYVDEVYQAFRSSHGQQLYDLEQVEVLRGPQGTLYGRNTTGGTISFSTRKPSLEDTVNGRFSVGYGNFSRVEVDGALEATLIPEKLGVRLAGTYVNSDPWMKNLLSSSAVNPTDGFNDVTGVDPGGAKDYGLRLSIRAEPIETLRIDLKGYAAKSKGGQAVPIGLPVIPGVGSFDTFVIASGLGINYSRSNGALNFAGRPLSSREVEVDDNGTAITRAEGGVATIHFDLTDTLTLTNITGYDSGRYAQVGRTDCDGTPISACSIGYDSHFEAINQDVRVNYTSNRLRGIVGFYYGWDQIRTRNTPNFYNFLDAIPHAATDFNPGGLLPVPPFSAVPTGVEGVQRFRQTRKSWALYGEASFDVTEALTLTGGIRYTQDDFVYDRGFAYFNDETGALRFVGVSNYTLAGAEAVYLPGVTPGPLPGPLRRAGDSAKVSGRVIAAYDLTESVMAYASYSRGYRAGTFNGLTYFSPQLVYFVPPEEVNAYEVGLKSRFFDDRVQLNVAGFYYDYSEQQGQIVDANATAFLVSLDAKMKGFEIDLVAKPLDRLTLRASTGFIDSNYTDTGACSIAIINAGNGFQSGNCIVAGNGNAINVSGNPVPYAARTSANLGADWDIAEIWRGQLRFHFDANYIGQFHYDAFGDYSNTGGAGVGPIARGDGKVWLANTRLAYDFDGVSVGFWVKNLFEEKYFPFQINLESNFALDYAVRNEPRTYGFEVSYDF